MGDPKKRRKKYQTPVHPWRKDRLEAEKIIQTEYGTKNKTELYKMDSSLRDFKKQIKRLLSTTGEQSEKEGKQIFDRLIKLGLLKVGATSTDEVLGLTMPDIMNRRLQTMVYKKGLARTMKQARQFITHGHILVGDKKITSPSYLLSVDEENKIVFDQNSSLFSDEHPERVIKSDAKLKKKLGKEEPKKAEPKMNDEELEVPEDFDESKLLKEAVIKEEEIVAEELVEEK